MFLGNESMQLMIPSFIKRSRISASLFRASLAEFAITKAARPFGLSEVAKRLIQR